MLIRVFALSFLNLLKFATGAYREPSPVLKADFVSKLQISLKECYETEYWLELFSRTNIISNQECSELKNDCGKIRRILISSINTTKEKYNL